MFPPVRACMFSSHLTAVTFLADPSAGGGLPRGTFIYATSPVPVQVGTYNCTTVCVTEYSIVHEKNKKEDFLFYLCFVNFF